jgi:hypothetical protein
MNTKRQSNETDVHIWYLEDNQSDVEKFRKVLPVLEDRLDTEIRGIYLKAANQADTTSADDKSCAALAWFCRGFC